MTNEKVWAGVLTMALSMAAAHGKESEVGQVKHELAMIPAVERGHVLARMSICHIAITSNSWVYAVPTNYPSQELKAGDVMISVEISVPPPPGSDEIRREAMRSLSAIWIRRGNDYLPQTGWAKSLQTKPYPLGWLNC